MSKLNEDPDSYDIKISTIIHRIIPIIERRTKLKIAPDILIMFKYEKSISYIFPVYCIFGSSPSNCFIINRKIELHCHEKTT